MNMAQRLESLDWLRGLMAMSIMLYHFGGHNDAATPLGRLGIYGVSIFFILSGLSMAIAYDHYIKDVRSSAGFFVRRLFRIWPLLWLAIALVAVPSYFSGSPYSATKIALNLSTLFGFIAPDQYINMGAWSIGNEMVYYAFTPVFILVYRWRIWSGNLLTAATALVGLAFAFYLLDPAAALEKQWSMYVNPFNNLFLYCAGLAIYYNLKNLNIQQTWHLPVLVSTIAVFFLYPVAGDQINIVTGSNRIAMSLIALAVVVAFYKCPPPLPEFFGHKFEQLGIATYGIYLLHPVVMTFVRSALHALGLHNKYLPPLVAIGVTIALALMTFKYIEAPLTRLGKRLTSSKAVLGEKLAPVTSTGSNT
jgi:exopolysaccharide production protein ExoZ